MKSEQGRRLHSEALAAHEQTNTAEALRLIDLAIVAYSNEGDRDGFAECLAAKVLILNAQADRTGSRDLLLLAKHIALAAVELADETDNIEQVGHANAALGRVLYKLEDFKAAMMAFVKARDSFEKAGFRKAILADMENHIGVCEYMEGDNAALQRAEDAIGLIERAGDASEFELGVWMSGGYLRLAHACMQTKNFERVNSYLDNAEKIAAKVNAKARLEQIIKMRELLSQKG